MHCYTKGINMEAASNFITVKYGANQRAIFNVWCTGRSLLDHIRKTCHCKPEDSIDLCDMEGNVCHLPTSLRDYVNTHVDCRQTYVLVKVDTKYTAKDQAKYTFLLEDVDTLHPELTEKIKQPQAPTDKKPQNNRKQATDRVKTNWSTMRTITRLGNRMSRSREGRRNSKELKS